ncbi:putative spore protein YtfJ [Clostridium pascui]|uniref:GerW family sporulation protein n=1 Tax=Clostridium pascui TaxID=46609 RepID=UPI001956C001|nr:spore germination protein GerW family protein [Clostridium pascui]MBM7869975.1 putative spore protein YtfJ [Clostridium pascui]
MNDTTNFSQNLGTLFSDLHNFVDTDSVLGKPLSVGDKTLVPVMSVTLGYGNTGMSTKMQAVNSTNASNGVGLGARVSTSSVMVIDKDNVSMLPVNEKSTMGQMMDKIPQALSTLGQNMMQPGMNQNQGQSQSQSSQNSTQNKQQNSSSSSSGSMS